MNTLITHVGPNDDIIPEYKRLLSATGLRVDVWIVYHSDPKEMARIRVRHEQHAQNGGHKSDMIIRDVYCPFLE